MAKTYITKVTLRSPRPRSKRRRELGGAASTSVVTISGGAGGGTGSAPVGDGHTHPNLSALNEITTDREGYLHLTQMRATENEDTGESVVEQVTEKVRAGYADTAHDLTDDSPVRKEFLSRLKDDTAQGHVTFAKGTTTHGTALSDVVEAVQQVKSPLVEAKTDAADGLVDADIIKGKRVEAPLVEAKTEGQTGLVDADSVRAVSVEATRVEAQSVEAADRVVEGRRPVAANLRFAHAETLMPLLSLLQIKGGYYLTHYFDQVRLNWQDYAIVPMAANVQFIFFKTSLS